MPASVPPARLLSKGPHTSPALGSSLTRPRCPTAPWFPSGLPRPCGPYVARHHCLLAGILGARNGHRHHTGGRCCFPRPRARRNSRPGARARPEYHFDSSDGHRSTPPPRACSGRSGHTSIHPRGSSRLWPRCRPRYCSPCLGCRPPQHLVPRLRRAGPDVLPLPSLVGAGAPHPAALCPR
jgi:hypothetical protein